MMRTLLDHQADGILYTLHSHGLAASISGGSISPRLIQFHIKLGSGINFNRVASLSDELSKAIGVKQCRITFDGVSVKVEVPHPEPETVQLFSLMRNISAELPLSSAILGLDENNIPLLLDLRTEAAHMLVSGAAGCGKSSLGRSMIASLALQNQPGELKMLLIDAKGRDYKDFEGLPNLICPVVCDPRDGLHRLKWATRHLENRLKSGINSPQLVIFIDEVFDLLQVNSREMEHQIRLILRSGQQAGIHLIISTSKILASQMAAIFDTKFPVRLVGRAASAQEALVASNQVNSGAERLMNCGDFLLLGSGELTRVQSAYISPNEVKLTVQHLGGQLVGSVRTSRQPSSRPNRRVARIEARPNNSLVPGTHQDEQDQSVAQVGERLTGYQSAIQQRRSGMAYAKSRN